MTHQRTSNLHIVLKYLLRTKLSYPGKYSIPLENLDVKDCYFEIDFRVRSTMGLRDVENIEVPGQGLRRVEILPLKTAVGFSGMQ